MLHREGPFDLHPLHCTCPPLVSRKEVTYGERPAQARRGQPEARRVHRARPARRRGPRSTSSDHRRRRPPAAYAGKRPNLGKALAFRLPFGGALPHGRAALREAPAPAQEVELKPRLAPEGALFVAVLGDVVVKHGSSFSLPAFMPIRLSRFCVGGARLCLQMKRQEMSRSDRG